jgi:hypothetical protein
MFKYFNTLLSTVTVINSTFDDSDIKTTTSLAIGGYFYLKISTLIVQNSTFIGCTAKMGSAIYSVESTLNITGSNFVNNSASTAGTIYLSTSKLVHLENCTFYNNNALMVDVLQLDSSEKTIIKDCIFDSQYPSSYIYAISENIEISGTVFKNSFPVPQSDKVKLKSDAAIATSGSTKMKVTNSTFMNLVTLNSVINSDETSNRNIGDSVDYLFDECQFIDNTAIGVKGTAGIYFKNPLNSIISNSKFLNNNATQGEGCALKYECGLTSCSLNTHDNKF